MTARYADKRLLKILRDLAAELGRSPTGKELQARRDLPSPVTYLRHFGSWTAALEAAGLETYRRTPAYTDEQLLQPLRDLASELGRTPTINELLARRDLPSPDMYVNRFESWNAALEAAGLETRGSPVYSDEQLVQILRDFAAELGRPPTGNELQARRDLPSPKPYYGHFGSWKAALEAAGLTTYRRHTPVYVYSDEQLVQTLRDLAAELGRSPTGDELKACRDLPALNTYERRFGSWTAALEAAGLETYRRTPAYTDEQLLQPLRDLAAELGRSPTGNELKARRDLPSRKTYYARFGSWIAALKAAGLETRRRPDYTDEQLLQILRDLAAELGRSPSDHEMQARRDLPSVKLYYKSFGGWNGALEAAGLQTRRNFPAYSDERLLQILRDLAAELGRSPTAREMEARRDLPSSITYRGHFGSWAAALEAAGLEPYRRSPDYSDEQLLQTLRDLAAKLGRSPSDHEMQSRRDLPSVKLYYKRFGGWAAALEAAGLQTSRSPDYSDEQLLQTLRDLAAKLGHSPTRNELQARRDLPSPNTYCGRFGSWAAALEAAGLEPYRRPPDYSDEQLLQTLRDLAAELDQTPTAYEMQARRDLPSPNTYGERFGSWTAALEKAGLQTSHRRRAIYTDEQLLQILRDLAAEFGRPPTINELLARRDLPTPATYFNRFESWNAALEAAGLQARYHTPVYSDEQLLQTLRDLAAELGRSPMQHELLARRDLPSPSSYRGHFASWQAALQAAGLTTYRRPPAHTDEQLLQTLRDLAAELGRTPTQRELQARHDLPSITVYYKHFGKWNTALEAAGLKLNRARPAD